MSVKRMRGALALAGVFLALQAQNAFAFSCTPVFLAGEKAGTAATCALCEPAISSALVSINTAISLSERVIGTAINEGSYQTGTPIGFPALQSVIEAQTAKSTKDIVDALGVATKRLGQEFRTMATRDAVNDGYVRAAFLPGQEELGCQQAMYGRATEQASRSSLGVGWQSLRRGNFLSDEDRRAAYEGVSEVSELSEQDAIASIAVSGESKALQEINKNFIRLKGQAYSAGKSDDEPIIDILNPAILVSERHQVFEDTPDEFGLSDDDRADYLMEYLTIDSPSYADAVRATATTVSGLDSSTSLDLQDMRVSSSMAVLDGLIQERRRHSVSLGGEDYLAEAMGDEAPEGASNESFINQITHFRQQDPNWVARTVVDDHSALSQLAQMEAEHLLVKYKRWLHKRSSNLMLAQILSNQLQKER